MRTTLRNVGRSLSRKEINDMINDEGVSSLSLDLSVAEQLMEGLNCPTSLGIYLCMKYGDLKSAVTHEVNPANYLNWRDYFDAKQAVSFLSKYPFRISGLDVKAAARDTFISCEKACKETNSRFIRWSRGENFSNREVDAAIFAARYKIQRVLGKFDPHEWLSSSRFGPGAVHGSPGESDYQKLSVTPGVTPEFRKLGMAMLIASPAWIRSLTFDRMEVKVESIPGGKYSQVPKNAKTNRNIETQPLLNGFAQLGIGSMLRRRLKEAGVDLDDQTRNQELARLGSISNELSTMDLSNASDTIATELVRWLIPSDWFYAMDSCRTRRIKFEGEYIPLERFCSMGNGFAFELESLIFWALATCAIENQGRRVRVAVYGDDIIVPSTYFGNVARTLEACGFTVNQKKSYSSGNFRESCGADWFLGKSVRPFFLKEGTTNVASLISLANGLRRAAHRRNNHLGYHRGFAAAWFRCVRWIPPKIRRRIAFGFTEHDDIVLSGRIRDGSAIVFQSTRLAATCWFTALATALYRNDRRNGPDFDPDRTIDYTRFDRFLDKSNGHIFDYRRDCGKWSLRKFQHLIDADPTMMWW